MEYSLQVHNLTKHYGDFSLDHVGFSLPAGTIMGFIGENGAGKSTTLKAILNIIKREEGDVQILGSQLDREEDRRRILEEVGVVLDECRFPEMLHAKAVSSFMSGIYRSWDSALFYRYLERFRLPLSKQVKDYSRGMKMKLDIAAALSHKPRLLILDEPTSGLDPVIRSEILDLFYDFIQDENHSILISSHITSDLEKLCDYITFIHKGRIIFSEAKDDVIYHYAVMKCTKDQFSAVSREDIAGFRKNSFGYEVLVRDQAALKQKYPDCIFDQAGLEDIMLFYARGEKL